MRRPHRYTLLHLAWSALLAFILLAGVAMPASAQERELRYTLSPVGGYLFESGNSALDGTLFYGGELGLGFGQYLQLSGEFLLRNGADADFTDFDELVGLEEPSVDLRRYGGRLRVNVGSGAFIPFLSIGTGVLEFDSDVAGSSRSIYATPGIGIGFEPVQGVRAAVAGELLSYRYDPATVFLGEDVGVVTDEETVYSPSVRASIELLLGGRTSDRPTAVDEATRRQFGNGLSGLQVFVSPFYGRLAFNDALGFPKDQNFAGANLGVDLGPFVGLRGFYGRGTPGDDVFDEFATGFEAIQLYGGELRLHLTPRGSGGFTPYGLLGGGYLDVLSEYSDDLPPGAAAPDDRYFATAGGGLEVPFTEWLSLIGDVRGVFMSGQDIEEVSSPDEVYGSLMYTVGLQLSVGGGGDEAPLQTVEGPPTPVTPDTMAGEQPPVRDTTSAAAPGVTDEAPDEALRTRVDSLQRQITDLERTIEAQQRSIEQDTMARSFPEDVSTDSLVTSGDVEQLVQRQVQQQVRAEVRARMQDIQADTVQVDTTRQMSEAEVERIARRTLREEGGQMQDTGVVAQQRSEIQQLESQINTLQQQIDALREEAEPVQAEAEEQPPQPQTEPEPQQQPGDQEPFYRMMLGRPLTGVLPSVGVRTGEGPTHMLIGVRGDYRTNPDARFRLMPEAFLGFGDGPASVGILANIGYGLLGTVVQDATNLPLEPYIGAGIGLVSPTGLDLEFVGNLMVGTDYVLDNGNALFLEIDAFNLFEYARFGGGYRIRF